MIRTWKITDTSAKEQNLADQSTLDAVTRQLPQGFYSTFRTYGGCRRVLGLSAHWRRLYEAVSFPEVSASSLRRQLRALLELYHPGEARVRAIMTKQGETFIAIEPLKELPLEVYENGVHVETTELQRQQPRLKSTSFIGQSDAERKHIAEEGIFEALLIKDGKILEGMTSNFFYVKIRREGRNEEQSKHEKILYTARYGVLLGVTRETVIQIAGDRGLDVKYQALKRDQLSAAREAFITSSSRGIVPVMRIDGVTIGQGRPGLVTKELMAAYQEYVLANAEQI